MSVDPGMIALILFAVMGLLLASGIWVAVSLTAVGFVAMSLFSKAPAGSLMAATVWDASWNWALTALPLFIWMGEILFRTRLSEDMFRGLSPLVGRLPGGLLHVNVICSEHLTHALASTLHRADVHHGHIVPAFVSFSLW